jgi:hypothetical protein
VHRSNHVPADRPAAGRLRSILEDAVRSNGGCLGNYTVLSAQRDPYRLDTRAGHRDAQWLAAEKLEQIRPQIDQLNQQLDVVEGVHLDLPPIEIPEPRLNGTPLPPLVSTEMDFATAARRLRDRKRYTETGAGDPA